MAGLACSSSVERWATVPGRAPEDFETTTALLIIGFLILLNGVFAMSEMAVVASRRTRLTERAPMGDWYAALAVELHNAPNVFLSTYKSGSP